MKYGLSKEIYQKILQIVETNKEYQFFLFGSRARGDFRNNSDIDIAVIGNVSSKEEFSIRNQFDLLDIPYTIDLVFTQNVAKKALLESIEKDGVKLGE